jgi:hypothetical protein
VFSCQSTNVEHHWHAAQFVRNGDTGDYSWHDGAPVIVFDADGTYRGNREPGPSEQQIMSDAGYPWRPETINYDAGGAGRFTPEGVPVRLQARTGHVDGCALDTDHVGMCLDAQRRFIDSANIPADWWADVRNGDLLRHVAGGEHRFVGDCPNGPGFVVTQELLSDHYEYRSRSRHQFVGKLTRTYTVTIDVTLDQLEALARDSELMSTIRVDIGGPLFTCYKKLHQAVAATLQIATGGQPESETKK